MFVISNNVETRKYLLYKDVKDGIVSTSYQNRQNMGVFISGLAEMTPNTHKTEYLG